MDVGLRTEPSPGVQITLDQTEASQLLSILMHAKFSEDVKLAVVLSPTTNHLLRGLLSCLDEMEGKSAQAKQPYMVEEKGGTIAPLAFAMIESELKELLEKDDVAAELAEALFPFCWIKRGTAEPRG